MSIYTSTIKQIESEFDDIYRITTENGLILDIPENKKPSIGTTIEYHLNTEKNENGYTIMNGIVFNTHNTGIIVSFGGLLANIPLNVAIKKDIKESVSLSYKLL